MSSKEIFKSSNLIGVVLAVGGTIIACLRFSLRPSRLRRGGCVQRRLVRCQGSDELDLLMLQVNAPTLQRSGRRKNNDAVDIDPTSQGKPMRSMSFDQIPTWETWAKTRCEDPPL
jgi:hypothetical protein